MANLYGRVIGDKATKEATRQGHAVLRTKAETWSGVITTTLFSDGEFIVEWSGKFGEEPQQLVRGNVDERKVYESIPTNAETTEELMDY